MRKPRDYDAELKALSDKAKALRTRKQNQLGELVIATGADALSVDELAGALLVAVATTDAAAKEAHRKRGAAFFQGTPRTVGNARHNKNRIAPNENGGQPVAGASGPA